MNGDARRLSGGRPRKPIIDGVQMICPRCKEYRNVLDYDRLEQNEEYEYETNAIYKCPKARGGCSWIFSPSAPSITEAMF